MTRMNDDDEYEQFTNLNLNSTEVFLELLTIVIFVSFNEDSKQSEEEDEEER